MIICLQKETNAKTKIYNPKTINSIINDIAGDYNKRIGNKITYEKQDYDKKQYNQNKKQQKIINMKEDTNIIKKRKFEEKNIAN